jgi:uncharacterized protein (DUF2141 family)
MKRNHALWSVNILLAALFAVIGLMKSTLPLTELAEIFPWTAAAPAPFIRFLGGAELAAAFGLVSPLSMGILPWLTNFTALTLTGVMVLATALHAARGEWAIVPVPVVVGALSAFVAWGLGASGRVGVGVATVITLCAVLSPHPALASDGDSIRMLLKNMRNDRGRVVCSLFSDPDAFPTEHARAVARVTVAARAGTVACSFPSVRPGVYAIAGFPDENSNGKLDMGLFGPEEGWFASRDARSLLAPPSFAKAKFHYDGSSLELTATLVY